MTSNQHKRHDSYDEGTQLQFDDTLAENELYMGQEQGQEAESCTIDSLLAFLQVQSLKMMVIELAYELRKNNRKSKSEKREEEKDEEEEETQEVKFQSLCDKYNKFDLNRMQWDRELENSVDFRQLLLQILDEILHNNFEDLFRRLFKVLSNRCTSDTLRKLFIEQQYIIIREFDRKAIKAGNFFFMLAYHPTSTGIYQFTIQQFRRKFGDEIFEVIISMKSQENKLALHIAAQRKNNTFLIENFKQLHKKMETFRRVLTQERDDWGNTVLHYLVISECVDAAQFLYGLMSQTNLEVRKKYAILIQRKDLYTKYQHGEHSYQVVDIPQCVHPFPKANRAIHMQKHRPECRVNEMIEILKKIEKQCQENEEKGLVEPLKPGVRGDVEPSFPREPSLPFESSLQPVPNAEPDSLPFVASKFALPIYVGVTFALVALLASFKYKHSARSWKQEKQQ